MANSNADRLPADTFRNPRFLGAGYAARGARVFDQRTRSLDFVGSGKAVPYKGDGQRWIMQIPLVDYDGTMKRNLRSHQEIFKQNRRFFMPVPQNPWVSFNVPIVGSGVRIVNDASKGDNELKIGPVHAGTIPIHPRWFFRLAATGDPTGDNLKVYHFAIDTSVSIGPASTDQRTVQIYPALIKDIPANSRLSMWPSMSVLWARLLSRGQLTLERRDVHQITVEVTENY